MKRRRHFPRLIVYCLVFLVFIGLIGGVIGLVFSKSEETSSGVAKVEVDLNNTTLEIMKNGEKETKYPGNQLRATYGGEEEIYQEVEVKGRGNLTWTVEKKPWQIKFSKRTNFLDITKAKKWCFLANYYDGSYIRSDLATKLAEMVGNDYNYRGKFAEVYFDGEYEGLFYVLPRIEIGKEMVNLKDEMGVVVELDNFRRDLTDRRYSSYAGNDLILKDAVFEDNEAKKQEAMGKFLVDFNQLEKSAEIGDFEKVAEVADLESFAEYFLVSEFSANPDAYTTSFYFYKDGASDKIHAGPMWDFDMAFSNAIWGSMSATETMERRAAVFGENGGEKDLATSKLMYYLMDMPEFIELVKNIYKERMAGRKDELIKDARRTVDIIREYAIFDSEKWQWGDFDTEVKNLLDWVEARYDYFEGVYGDKNQEIEKSVI